MNVCFVAERTEGGAKAAAVSFGRLGAAVHVSVPLTATPLYISTTNRKILECHELYCIVSEMTVSVGSHVKQVCCSVLRRHLLLVAGSNRHSETECAFNAEIQQQWVR